MRKNRSTFRRTLIPVPSVCSRNYIRRTSSSDFRATVSKSWRGSDATAPLLEDTIGHAPTPPRAHHRGDTVGVPHLLHAPRLEDIAAGDRIPALHQERAGRTRGQKPLKREASLPRKIAGALLKPLRNVSPGITTPSRTTTKENPGETGTTLP